MPVQRTPASKLNPVKQEPVDEPPTASGSGGADEGSSSSEEMSEKDERSRSPDKLTILTRDNYARWKYDIVVALTSRRLLAITEGHEVPPNRPAEDAGPLALAEFRKKRTD